MLFCQISLAKISVFETFKYMLIDNINNINIFDEWKCFNILLVNKRGV